MADLFIEERNDILVSLSHHALTRISFFFFFFFVKVMQIRCISRTDGIRYVFVIPIGLNIFFKNLQLFCTCFYFTFVKKKDWLSICLFFIWFFVMNRITTSPFLIFRIGGTIDCGNPTRTKC